MNVSRLVESLQGHTVQLSLFRLGSVPLLSSLNLNYCLGVMLGRLHAR